MDNIDNKNQVYNLIILDESGSMQSIKTFIIEAFNKLTDNIRTITKKFPMQQHYISLITFNGYGVKKHYWNENIENFINLSNRDYVPNENTPLLDTIGIVITKLKKELLNKDNYDVIVTILTDGEENASVEYTHSQIKKLITELQETKRWTFAYIGTEHDIHKAAEDIGIANKHYYSKSFDSICYYTLRDSKAREIKYQKLASGIRDDADFFKED